jgi:hypothetical protein
VTTEERQRREISKQALAPRRTLKLGYRHA